MEIGQVFFYYWGNDQGFIEWSKKRVIEDFSWQPTQEICLDLSHAQIHNFSIKAEEHPITLVLNHPDDDKKGLYSLHLAGHIEHFEIITTAAYPHIRIEPTTNKDQMVSAYDLPVMKNLATITSLDLTVKPLGQAFNCESLLQFPNLKNLNLTGNITNTASLKQLRQLERIGIRYAVNLEGFPVLNTWENLTSFIGWNIDEKTGKG